MGPPRTDVFSGEESAIGRVGPRYKAAQFEVRSERVRSCGEGAKV